MNNMSDYLRAFPERPKDIKWWDWKSESYLTLSARIEENDEFNKGIKEKLGKFQNEITDCFENTYKFHDPYMTREWFGCGGLFKYPYECLHFSLINFLTFHKCGFDDFKQISKENCDYKITRNLIVKTIDKTINEYKLSKTEAELRWLYTDGEKGIDSFALGAYPEKRFFNDLKKIKEEVKEKVPDENIFKHKLIQDIEIKAYPTEDNPRYLAINILRFMAPEQRPLLGEVIGEDKMKAINIIERINRKHDCELLAKLRIKKISLVESDPFLYNYNTIGDFPLR